MTRARSGTSRRRRHSSRRVLRDDGTLWVVIGDSYSQSSTYQAPRTMHTDAGWKQPAENRDFRLNAKSTGIPVKNLIGIPWRLAFALQDDGWILRQEIIWSKPSGMPENVKDRPSRAHEQVFLFSKRLRYYYDAAAIAEPVAQSSQDRAHLGKRPISARQQAMQDQGMHGKSDTLRVYDRETRNARSVWTIAPTGIADEHYAPMPEELARRCILASTTTQACESCGAAWERQYEATGHVNERKPAHTPNNSATKTSSTGWKPTTRATDRFAPGCGCAVNTGGAASVVLDPFMGSGTVGRVAEKLQRHAIGIDLGYQELQAKRTDKVQVEMFV